MNHYLMIWHLILVNFLMGYMVVPSSPEAALSFDIVHKNKTVGSLEATQTTKDSKTYYHSSTTIETKIVKKIAVHYKYDVIFENEILKKADVNITLNNKTHANTLTQWEDTEYQIAKNGKNGVSLKDTIDYATILLYFKEPINIDRCFSEQDGSFNTIVSLGNHSYKKVNSKGKENIYYYKSGVLEKAVIDGGLIKFEMFARN